jgi:predicted ATPase
MYLKRLIYENVGPIEELDIYTHFNNGNPNPLIFVGQNGSGKTLLLSNIVDSFYEIAGKAYDNVRISSSSNKYQFFKTMAGKQIKIGKEFLLSYIEYSDYNENEGDIISKYIYKIGKLDEDFINSKFNISIEDINVEDSSGEKRIFIDEDFVKDSFSNQIFCYFGPDRYEKPDWMGEGSYKKIKGEESFKIKERNNGTLYNDIIVKRMTEDNLSWLMDIIVDSRTEIEENEGQISIVRTSPQNALLFGKALANVEIIMSAILGKDVYFKLSYRNAFGNRFSIYSKDNNSLVVPSLSSLSTGQLALFNIFATIIRYADENDIKNSINLNQISGIVVIDEVELHLHTDLQREILPKLFSMFPKIQFIVTSHSPLFLLGMEEVYQDNIDIIQLPEGNRITTEGFTEFQKAYIYLEKTNKFQKEIKNVIETNTTPLIITEGATDWRHIKTAFECLKNDNRYSWLKEMNFEFLEYNSSNKYGDDRRILNMNKDSIIKMCETLPKMPFHRKIILIADRDDKDIRKNLNPGEDYKFKKWGEGVYSILLPVPEHRKNTPEICIEHYYSDDEIKTSVMINGINRRLFMGYEFDREGRNRETGLFCTKRNICGKDKINIIEGSEDERVIDFNGGEENLALPKMEFAERIYKREAPFDKIKFDSFIPLFEVINDILNESDID